MSKLKLRAKITEYRPINGEYLFKIQQKSFWGWDGAGTIWAATAQEAMEKFEREDTWTYNE